MRLLSCADDGEYQMRTFLDNLPRYAILSHTWAVEEISYHDMMSNTFKDKPGSRKLSFLARQAETDGFKFFWMDTCCIDKSSSAELSEAVHSSFTYYRNASKCYVYLADVRDVHGSQTYQPENQYSWHSSFRTSRWFTRAWTLQELIAPSSMEFFSADGTLLGDKRSLAHVIQDITQIPTEVLLGDKSLDDCEVAERMSWAAKRMSTRVEDKAYSLMGLFNVNMPLLYGEGDIAMQRLQREIMSQNNQASGLRLLRVDSHPLIIETFMNAPECGYAILSHVWTAGEVSFQDVLIGRAQNRRGYAKVKNCCELAARQGYKYLWVDTCSIDKTSSSELQEAICSMYQWYEQAQVCYVYLHDYDPRLNPLKELSSCRWFKRGWTLQELIAPRRVEFYDSSWTWMGDKESLRKELAEITRIDPRVLQGANPLKRSVAERMSWASGRNTTRIEDTAYSLMGLFDVFMPMLYGEGERAFVRLQEEIMKKTEDYTLFAWRSEESSPRRRGLFARNPSEFHKPTSYLDANSERLYAFSHHHSLDMLTNAPAAITSRGVFIGLPLLAEDTLVNMQSKTSKASRIGMRMAVVASRFPIIRTDASLARNVYLALSCWVRAEEFESQLLCIWLLQDKFDGIFTRLWPNKVKMVPAKYSRYFRRRTVYVRSSGTY